MFVTLLKFYFSIDVLFTMFLNWYHSYSSSKFGWVKAKSDELLLPMMKQFNQKQVSVSHVLCFKMHFMFNISGI